MVGHSQYYPVADLLQCAVGIKARLYGTMRDEVAFGHRKIKYLLGKEASMEFDIKICDSKLYEGKAFALIHVHRQMFFVTMYDKALDEMLLMVVDGDDWLLPKKPSASYSVHSLFWPLEIGRGWLFDRAMDKGIAAMYLCAMDGQTGEGTWSHVTNHEELIREYMNKYRSTDDDWSSVKKRIAQYAVVDT